MTGGFILDTNHLSAAIGRNYQFRNDLHARKRRGEVLGTCFSCLCELEAGIRQLGKPLVARQHLSRLRRIIKVWPDGWDIVAAYGDAHRETRLVGRKLSHVDLVVAANARVFNLTIASTDTDFEALPDLRVENWLAQ